MWEKTKLYLINVALSKYLPIGVMACMGAVGTFLAAHAGVLETWGITYGTWPFHWNPGETPSGPCLLIEFDTTSAALISLLAGLIAMAFRAVEHHVATMNQPPKEVPSEQKK